MAKTTKSIEEKVEDYYKQQLNNWNIRTYAKNESINDSISKALSKAKSKSGGSGGNRPDIQLYLEGDYGRNIPVMIEAKGSNGKLEALDKDGFVRGVEKYEKNANPRKDGSISYKKGDWNYSYIQNYAVNGAVHYANAILDYSDDYDEVIAIGVNGVGIQSGNGQPIKTECKAYYLAKKNGSVPKHIPELDDDLILLKPNNREKLYKILDDSILTDEERENATRHIEIELDTVIASIHQEIYENERTKELLNTNSKLYLFCGLILASLKIEKLPLLHSSDLESLDDNEYNDGQTIIKRIKRFLDSKKADEKKCQMLMRLFESVFTNDALWKPINGESLIKTFYKRVEEDVTPKLTSPLRLDFMGRIFNSLNDWVKIEKDEKNDVVLTPRYVTLLMAKICRTNRNSIVWDTAMGSGGFLVSAMDIMIRDAETHIKDERQLQEKIERIKKNQLLGIEILDSVFMLAVLNMILMGDGSSNMYWMDSHKYTMSDGNENTCSVDNFDANVFLLNPPYSAPGKGFNFVKEALDKMSGGYAAILIMENAGSGQGTDYTKDILKDNTLLASVHMPKDLFRGKSGAQTAIYVFKVNRPHEEDDIVKFINFSNDGYTRANRRKSSANVNLKDSDNAKERYAEVEALILGKKPKTSYYTKENGLYIEDTISLNGDDWTFAQHQIIDTVPKEEDFKRVVADYLSWKVGMMMQQKVGI